MYTYSVYGFSRLRLLFGECRSVTVIWTVSLLFARMLPAGRVSCCDVVLRDICGSWDAKRPWTLLDSLLPDCVFSVHGVVVL